LPPASQACEVCFHGSLVKENNAVWHPGNRGRAMC
jgi:hypothetical protein